MSGIGNLEQRNAGNLLKHNVLETMQSAVLWKSHGGSLPLKSLCGLRLTYPFLKQ